MKIEKHPDYHTLDTAHKELSNQALKNQKLINEKLQRASAADPKRKALEVLKGQNEDTAARVDMYFKETSAALIQTIYTLDYVRNGKFLDEVGKFLAQLELVEMRLHAGTEGGVEDFDIYPCQNRWHVSEATSTESLADFATQEDAEAYAVKLRRRFRLLTLLSIL